MLRKRINTLAATSLLLLSLAGCGNASETEGLSNGLIEVQFDPGKGTFNIIDVRRGDVIIEQSSIAFVIADYMELTGLAEDEIETSSPEIRVSGPECTFRLEQNKAKGAFSGGNSITLFCKKDKVGELGINFILYPDKSYVDVGFSFINLSKEDIRLRRVDLIDSKYFSNLDSKYLHMLNGDSGGKENMITTGDSIDAENNALCYFSNEDKQRSLVAGGLTYADFRKYVNVSPSNILMYAWDPVGKRIDAGQTYNSTDHFYLDASIDNPFDALESYAEISREARNINLNYYAMPSVCMWFLSVTTFGADATAENSTVGAVEEMQDIVKSGFLKYSPVAVRLVPDCYEQNNEQGWWDDKHWQMHGRKYRCVVDHHYKKPYETTSKWASKIRELGGIPLTYFQPGIRSEDYAETYPDHMLYNKAQKYVLREGEIVGDPHGFMGTRGEPDLLNPGKKLPGYGKMWAESYDYTDTEFLSHWKEVNQNLKNGGVQGVFYDYPSYAFPVRGGLEDRYSTATQAYCNVFRVAREVLGPNSYQQERLGIGSDATLGFVSSVRTAGDNNIMTPSGVRKASLRWYKNRRLVNYDLDGKALVEAGHGAHRYEISPLQRRSILTLSYTVSGRLLLTESFSKYSPQIIFDLSRVFPFHSTNLSARPLDAFISEYPSIFDFNISPDWHQLVLYNGEEESREMDVSLSGNSAYGALGLDSDDSYYLYDFWNDSYVGKFEGNSSVKQILPAGEARMISVHAVQKHPQWISTDRHVMQGYVDLIEKPRWDSTLNTLSGVSSVIGGESYKITLALNSYIPVEVSADGGVKVGLKIRKNNPNLADLTLGIDENRDVSWKIIFGKLPK